MTIHKKERQRKGIKQLQEDMTNRVRVRVRVPTPSANPGFFIKYCCAPFGLRSGVPGSSLGTFCEVMWPFL